ncbi:MAG: hypothetical protein HYS87_01225 [Candidatus Colwellbacteria bacterium]|nr:hypothetical protein [Candidatus Colwellbacteria bacterium]
MIENPFKAETFPELIALVFGFLTAIAIPIASIMILWGAFKLLTSGGIPEKITEGKKIILYAIIGLALVLVAQGFIFVLNEVLLGAPDAGSV